MGYSAGMRDKRVTFFKQAASTTTEFGTVQGAFAELRTVWAAVDWTKGKRAMQEGALEAYDTIMVRCAYQSDVDRDCRLKWDGVDYQILTLHSDRRKNTTQIVATEVR